MKNQEKTETSIDYFFNFAKNYSINLGYLFEAYLSATKMHKNEIDEAKKEAYAEGWHKAVKHMEQLESINKDNLK
jgi:hypothetical protein